MASEGFFDAKVLVNKNNAEGIQFVELEVSKEVQESFKVPGQYVQMKRDMGSKAGFYAMCSSPAKPTFEFIVKNTETNAFLFNAKEGDTVEMSLSQGKGFPIKEAFDTYRFDFPTTHVRTMRIPSFLCFILCFLFAFFLSCHIFLF